MRRCSKLWLGLVSRPLDLHPTNLQFEWPGFLIAEHEAHAADLVGLNWPHALNAITECRGNEANQRDGHLGLLVFRGRQRSPIRESHSAALRVEIEDVFAAVAFHPHDDGVAGFDVEFSRL